MVEDHAITTAEEGEEYKMCRMQSPCFMQKGRWGHQGKTPALDVAEMKTFLV